MIETRFLPNLLAWRTSAINLKRLRENYPLTVRELEDKSKVSHIIIGNLENHGQNARPSTVRKLAEALNIEPGELYKR